MAASRVRKAWRWFAAVFGGRQSAAMTFAVGLVVLLLLQAPLMERSFLGEPDREMMQSAFKLRADVLKDRATPALMLDFDNAALTGATGGPEPFKAPVATTPRAAIGDLLEFIRTAPAATAPKVVILDVDIAAPASDGREGEARLAQVLAAWSATPTAPPLIIAREAYPAAALGMDGDVPVLPDTPYEAIVGPAPNIFWANVKVLGDQNAVVREFLPYECVLTRQGVKPLYSAAVAAYGYMEDDPKVRDRSGAERWLREGQAACATHRRPLAHGERIDFHLSMGQGFADRVWPSLSPKWPDRVRCGDQDAPVFRRQSAGDILAALRSGAELSHDLLCRRLVVIGGTNGVAGDFVQSPLDEMGGSMVLVNAARGLQLSGGGLKAIPLYVQIGVLFAICLLISAASEWTDRARDKYLRHTRGEKRGLVWRIALLPLNPLVFNAAIAFSAHWLGVGLLLVSLNFGFWSFLSAPVIAAALAESIQEFTDEIAE